MISNRAQIDATNNKQGHKQHSLFFPIFRIRIVILLAARSNRYQKKKWSPAQGQEIKQNWMNIIGVVWSAYWQPNWALVWPTKYVFSLFIRPPTADWSTDPTSKMTRHGHSTREDPAAWRQGDKHIYRNYPNFQFWLFRNLSSTLGLFCSISLRVKGAYLSASHFQPITNLVLLSLAEN